MTGMEEVMGSHGVDAVLRLAALEQYIQNYPPAGSERDFSFETVSLIAEHAGAAVRSARRARSGFARGARLFQVRTQRIRLDARAD